LTYQVKCILDDTFDVSEGQCFVLAAGTVLSRGKTIGGARLLGTAADEALLLLDSMLGQDELNLFRILEE